MVQNRIQQNARTQEAAHAVPSMDSAAQADAPPAEATTAMSSGLGEATALYTYVSCALIIAASKELKQATCPLRKANASFSWTK